VAQVVIHSNPHLANQIESAGWLKQGFEACGEKVEITAERRKGGDIHVVQGPHYALNDWYGKENVIWLDRCFYFDSRYDLSIGWLNSDGSRDFKNQNKTQPNGPLPELKPLKKTQDRAIVFTDYGQRPDSMMAWAKGRYKVLEHRPHPAERPEQSCAALGSIWSRFEVAIGHSSTVLVEAAIRGLEVVSFDPRHVCQGLKTMYRKPWLTKLSWAQWHFDTGIQSGDFWEHLK